MMKCKFKQSIQTRISASFLLLALIISTFFSIVTYTAVEVAEDQLAGDRMQALSAWLIQRRANGQPTDLSPGMSFYVNEAIPKELNGVSDGLHDLDRGNLELNAYVQTVGTDRFVLIDESGAFEHTEAVVFNVLICGFAGSVLLAIMLGLTAARRVVAPVVALAGAVAKPDPLRSLPSLTAGDEIGELARALSHYIEQQSVFLAREKLFTGDVSHELRTPLTVILGAAELLEAQIPRESEAWKAAQRIKRSATEAAERVGALLALSRAPQLLDQQNTLLSAVLEHEVDRCRPMIEGKPVTFLLKLEPVVVHANPELVGVIVSNLLRNACQYMDSGRITVVLTTTTLVIEDDGPGIPEPIRARVFDRYVCGHPNYSGEGLGLSIVKRAVEHLGWHIELETMPKRGARFVIFLTPAGVSESFNDVLTPS